MGPSGRWGCPLVFRAGNSVTKLGEALGGSPETSVPGWPDSGSCGCQLPWPILPTFPRLAAGAQLEPTAEVSPGEREDSTTDGSCCPPEEDWGKWGASPRWRSGSP